MSLSKISFPCWWYPTVSQHHTITQLPLQSLVNSLWHKHRMTTNLLKLSRKTAQVGILSSTWMAALSPCPWSICNLGVILDSTLSYESHIKSVTKSTFCYLKSCLDPLPCIHHLPPAPLHWGPVSGPQQKPGQALVCAKSGCQGSHPH